MTENITWEEATVRSFIVKGKRDRILDALSKPSKRKKLLTLWCHHNDFDPRKIQKIEPRLTNAEGIGQILQRLGAGETCHAISEHSSLDNQELSLHKAVNEIIGRGITTLLCCIPGKLAYFENEAERFILVSND